jgi:hypothetical protein
MERLTVARPQSGAGMEWLKQGWQLFRRWPVPWMGMTAAAFLAIFGISMVPVAGRWAVELLSPLLVAGYMFASQAAERGEPVTFFFLGAGARRHARPLLILGAVYLVVGLLIGKVMQMLGGSSLQELVQMAQSPGAQSPEAYRAVLDQSLSAVLVGLLLYMPLLMATWFAPALVVFKEFSPANALWWSLWTCFANWRPILLYSLVMGVIAALAMLIPFGLGLLVFLPCAMTSTYIAFNQQFVPGRAQQ